MWLKKSFVALSCMTYMIACTDPYLEEEEAAVHAQAKESVTTTSGGGGGGTHLPDPKKQYDPDKIWDRFDESGGDSGEHKLAPEFRSVNGSGNHPKGYGTAAISTEPLSQSEETLLVRLGEDTYLTDGSTPDVGNLPHPRIVSNELMDQTGPNPNTTGMSHFSFFWGQFVDHDVTLTAGSKRQ